MKFHFLKIESRSIGFRIFGAFVALFALLTVSFAYWGAQSLESSIRSNASNELRVLSVVLARQVRRHLIRVEENMSKLAKNTTLRETLNQEEFEPEELLTLLNEKLLHYSTINPLFESLAIFLPDGDMVAATDQRWQELDFKKKIFFQKSLKDFGLGEVLAPEQEQWQLAFQPIFSHGKIVGVLLAQLNLQTITDLISEKIEFLESTQAFVVDAGFHRITPLEHDLDSVLVEPKIIVNLEQVLARHIDHDFWVEVYNNEQSQPVLGAALRISRYEWSLVVERDYLEVIKPLNGLKKAIILAAMATILLMTLITYFLTRSIVKPLLLLVEDTQRIANGDFSQQIHVSPKIREVHFLASEIDKMRVKIEKFQQQMLKRLETSEKQRLANERLASIGTLASTLAHEIRNPLNAMTLLLSRLELSKPTAELFSNTVVNIRGEIGRLERLVSAILDYSKPIFPNLKSMDLVMVINQILALYRLTLEERGIHCIFDHSEMIVEVFADQDQIKQCLVNLLQNAIDASATGGEIEIEAHRESEWAVVSIKDNGIGLQKDSEGKLFDLFFTTKEKGTGLGLSTVKKIIDAHSGQISITQNAPEIGSGLCVKFRLPGVFSIK